MPHSFIIIISITLYCIVNACLSALLFPLLTGLARRRLYLRQFLWFSFVAAFSVLAFQMLFLVYQCRFEKILYKFFGATAPACVYFHPALFLMHVSLLSIFFFYGMVTVIHYFLITSAYELSKDQVLIMVVITNAIACVAKSACVWTLIA